MSKKDFDSMIYSLGVLLADESQGLLNNMLKKDFYKEYKDFDIPTAWECFVEEVNRVNDVLELHEVLVDLDDECIKKINDIINRDVNE